MGLPSCLWSLIFSLPVSAGQEAPKTPHISLPPLPPLTPLEDTAPGELHGKILQESGMIHFPFRGAFLGHPAQGGAP